MNFTNLKYSNSNHSIISAEGGGKTLSIPAVEGNTEYDTIISEELTIADYVAPAETMGSIRGKRNQLLKDTDWQASSDRTMSDAETVYRQALRDLPAQDVDGPGDVVWPSAP